MGKGKGEVCEAVGRSGVHCARVFNLKEKEFGSHCGD